jgi:predicted nucleic acid-binding Zn ribbon protein
VKCAYFSDKLYFFEICHAPFFKVREGHKKCSDRCRTKKGRDKKRVTEIE